MKNKFLAVVLVALMVSGISVNAQNFAQGDKVINIGLGLGSALYGSGYKMSIPPISASFEIGVKDDVGSGNIGVGGYLGIAGSKYEVNYGYGSYGFKYTYIVIGVRGAYHFKDISDKLDLYGGLMPYYAIVNYKETGTANLGLYSATPSFLGVAFYGGARYYFSEKIAGMAELGYGVSYLNIGIAIKI